MRKYVLEWHFSIRASFETFSSIIANNETHQEELTELVPLEEDEKKSQMFLNAPKSFPKFILIYGQVLKLSKPNNVKCV